MPLQSTVRCTPSSAGLWRTKPRLQRRLFVCHSGNDGAEGAAGSKDKDTAAAEAPPPDPDAREPSEGFYWWDRPAGRQTNPLRRTATEVSSVLLVLGSKPISGAPSLNRSTPPPLHPSTQPGRGGEYLDSERLTRDPLRLAVGRRGDAAPGATLPLPGDDATPAVSWALAAAAGAGGAAYLAGLLPYYGMQSAAVTLLDEWWRLYAASLQPVSPADAVATLAALLTAGAAAERRLGAAVYATAFLGGGTLLSVIYYSYSSLGGGGDLAVTHFEGAGAALLAVAGALGAYLATNWRVLSAGQRGRCAAAAAGCTAALLPEAGLVEAEYLTSAGLGLLLGLAAGPRLEVLRELDIQEGSLTISGDEAEVAVVVDKVTAPRRWGACAAAAALLWALASLACLAAQVEALELLEEMLGGLSLSPELLQALEDAQAAAGDADPAARRQAADELRQQLFEAAPQAFPTA